jgi:UDP-2,3-diacylglucosamine pyrophosphatase LpxH
LCLLRHVSNIRSEAQIQRGAEALAWSVATAAFNYLLLSDVHLGSDLVPHQRPWGVTSWLKNEAEVDQRLVSLLEYYQQERDPERPWRLIFAGDFLDLVGVALAPSKSDLRTEPSPEEERHGLGSAADHVVCKMGAIAKRHGRVFRALMRFLEAGHSLVIVRGNHDIELHWEAAQTALVQAIVDHAPEQARIDIAARIQVCPWFFCVDGLLYVEHGHEFDAMCSYGDPLDPTSMRDPRRIRDTPFSVLLRHVARPTRGVNSESHGYVGMEAYLTLLRKLGVSGSFQIAVRFMRASHRLVAESLSHTKARAKRQARRARARLRRFARPMGVHERHLLELTKLYVQPAVDSVDAVIRSLYLDRILCLLSLPATILFAGLAFYYGASIGAVVCSAFALAFATYAAVGRGKNTSPTARMRAAAGRIAELFKARWVVMGHTHEPVFVPLSTSSHYVNLGSWGKDDPPDEHSGEHPSSCTFLVIRAGQGDYHAEFLHWNQDGFPETLSNPPG